MKLALLFVLTVLALAISGCGHTRSHGNVHGGGSFGGSISGSGSFHHHH